MIGFWLAAIAMLAIAGGIIVIPFRRRGLGRPMMAVVPALLVAVGALGIYFSIYNHDWPQVVAARKTGGADNGDRGHQMATLDEAAAGLAARLKENPDDVDGWTLLGRTYRALQRYDESVKAFRQAYQRSNGADPSIAVDYGEAQYLASGGGRLQPEVVALFESAAKAAPRNAKALWYGGLAAMQRGQQDVAVQRWQRLLTTDVPDNVKTVVRQQLAQLGVAEAPAAESASADAGSPAGAAPTDSGKAATGGQPRIDLQIEVADAIGDVPADTPVFVFARSASPGPPLAVKRLKFADLPAHVTLTDDDAMVPGSSLAGAGQLQIVARIARSGSPTEQPGDVSGSVRLNSSELPASATVVIDTVAR